MALDFGPRTAEAQMVWADGLTALSRVEGLDMYTAPMRI